LFAPKSGEELRGDIADATRKGIDRSREAAQELQQRAGEYYEVTKDRAADIYSTATERVTDADQKAREAAAGQIATVSAAIEAGRKAYQNEKRKMEMSGRTEAAPNYREKS
jgi:gas vesicle protein